MASIEEVIQQAATITPVDSPLTVRDIIQSSVHRDLATPKAAVGDRAPDFLLPVLDFSTGHGRPTNKTISLASYAGRQPVALIFGSYT